MKRVLSVSLGSSTRDHATDAEFLGQHFRLVRQGTDGDFERYIRMFQENDGKVDAFGVGGAEFYVLVNGIYYFRISMFELQIFQLSCRIHSPNEPQRCAEDL